MNYRLFILGALLCAVIAIASGEPPDINLVQSDRPGEAEGPTVVWYCAYVVDIVGIDGARQMFAANVFLRLRWKDERLIGDAAAGRPLPLQSVWNPRVLITNKQGIVRECMPHVVEVEPDGTVTYYQRFVGTFSHAMRLSQFPFDKHWFTLQFVSVGHSPEEIEFKPDLLRADADIVGGAMHESLSIPDWKVENFRVMPRPFEPVKGIKTAGFVFEFKARRYGLYYIWQIMIPLILIVMMSWGAFWIDPTHAGAQIGVATSSMLTLIAFRFMLGGLIPRLPYMTRLDYFTLGSTVLVFLTLVEVIATSILARNGRAALGRRMDLVSRFVFPTVFAAWCAYTMVA